MLAQKQAGVGVCYSRLQHAYAIQINRCTKQKAKPISTQGRSQKISRKNKVIRAAADVYQISESGRPRTAVVGVLGGGQLGRMMSLAAGNMGVKIKFLDPTENAPAAVAAEQIVGSFRDQNAISQISEEVDVLTVEIEHVDTQALQDASEQKGIEVQPAPSTIELIQDKLQQKRFFAKASVPVATFMEVKKKDDIEHIAEDLGLPLMLKSRRLAYDGRGNCAVKSFAELESGVEALGGYDHGLYAERWAPFVKEISVMVARTKEGEMVSYPVTQTIHKDSICHVTETPANIPESVRQRAQDVAESAVALLQGAGIFGVEMFLLPDMTLLLNEIAPRPHNSGHYTMDACACSQFEQHLRAVLGWPLGDTSLLSKSAIMLNIIGEADGEEGLRLAHQLMSKAYKIPGACVHWYDKQGCRKARKIGHINIVGQSRAQCREALGQLSPQALESLESTEIVQDAGEINQASVDEEIQKELVTDKQLSLPQVGIIMGSDSDLATMKAAAEILNDFDIKCEVSVVSAHRTPDRMFEYAKTAHERGVKVIIAGAGGAAHLPGMVAAMTPLPVIGVPVKPTGAYLDGLDSLLSIVQMPKGVPVATVAIGNAANAGLLAVRMLGMANETIRQKMLSYQQDMKQIVLEKAKRLENEGWEKYQKN